MNDAGTASWSSGARPLHNARAERSAPRGDTTSARADGRHHREGWTCKGTSDRKTVRRDTVRGGLGFRRDRVRPAAQRRASHGISSARGAAIGVVRCVRRRGGLRTAWRRAGTPSAAPSWREARQPLEAGQPRSSRAFHGRMVRRSRGAQMSMARRSARFRPEPRILEFAAAAPSACSTGSANASAAPAATSPTATGTAASARADAARSAGQQCGGGADRSVRARRSPASRRRPIARATPATAAAPAANAIARRASSVRVVSQG
jgi:hypothetical protein